MIRNFKRTASAIGVVAAGSIALVACNSAEQAADSAAQDGAAAVEGLANQAGELVGEGASSQQNAMQVFGSVYSETVDGASLAYNPTGSGSGRTNFIANQVDFAGSDSPLKDDQVEPAAERCGGNEAWHLPFVIGPVAIAYNLEGVDTLALDIPTLASIFKGEITKWNDPAIAELNEGVELPDQNITVVARSDESGTTGNVQNFLKAAVPDQWDTEGEVFPIPSNGESANGSNGVATQVKQIPGSITYVESGFAKQNDLGVAQLDFGAGPTELTPETVGTALDALEFETEGHNMVVNSEALFQQNQEGSYPLVLTTYEIVCSAGYDEETQNLVKDFLNVSLQNQDQLEQIGFIPINPESTHGQRLQDAIDAIGEGA